LLEQARTPSAFTCEHGDDRIVGDQERDRWREIPVSGTSTEHEEPSIAFGALSAFVVSEWSLLRRLNMRVIARIVYSHPKVVEMPRKISNLPRKEASQGRSRATVEALLDATARVLVREGYDRTSTNRVAQIAGVSVGSLYQYFPSKEALVAAVIERHNNEMMQIVRQALGKVALSPIEIAARELVSVMINAHRVDPKLHRILAEQTPRVGRLQNIERVEQEALALVRAYLDAHSGEVGVEDLDLAAFFCVTIVEALTHAAIVHRPEAVSNDQVDKLTNEITYLLVSYLRGRKSA
jgi:AcrR family transcriptional regulator